MGSFQRGWSDAIEEEVSEEMGLSLTENNFSIGDAVSEKSGETFEIKASSSKNYSFNTLANIGQNSLTDYGIFETVSWRDFRRVNFDKKKEEAVKGLSMAYIKNNEPKLKSYIEGLALADKLDYIDKLSKAEYSKDNLKVFLLNCLLGTCKKKSYKKDITIEDLETSNFVLVNSNKEKKILNKREVFESIDFDNLFLTFNKDNTHIKVCDKNMEILRISFHWKNKFQGGETPCLNVFLSSAFKENLN